MLERGCQMPEDLNFCPDKETVELLNDICSLEWWYNQPGFSCVSHCTRYLKILN